MATSTIPHKPCSIGLLLVVAWTVVDVPVPASFANIPLEAPFEIAFTTVAPENPPIIGAGLKAYFKIL